MAEKASKVKTKKSKEKKVDSDDEEMAVDPKADPFAGWDELEFEGK